MANWDFPSNPNIGDIYSFGGKSWQWNGSGWQVRSMTDELVDEVKGYRDDTQDLYDQFTQTFLGSLSTDPAGAAVGAMYYNTTDDIIRQLTDTGWVNLGNGVLSGTTAPTPTTGRIGDFYINTTTGTLYGPKTSGGWGTGFTYDFNVRTDLATDSGSSLVGFKQTGSTLSRTTDGKNKEQVSILDYYLPSDSGDYAPALGRALAQSAHVFFPFISGGYTFSSAVILTLTRDVVVDFRGMPINFNNGRIRFTSATVATGLTLSADIARYATSVTVNSTTGIQPGDIFYIETSAIPQTGWTYTKKDCVKVKSITSSTVIELEERIQFSYTSGESGLSISIYRPYRVKLLDPNFTLGTVNGQAMCELYYCHDVEIQNPIGIGQATFDPVNDVDRRMFQIYRSIGITVKSANFSKLSYPILFVGASRNLKVNGVNARGCRHVVETADWAKGMIVENMVTSDCYQSVSAHPSFDANYNFVQVERDSSLSNLRCVRGSLKNAKIHTICDNTETGPYFQNISLNSGFEYLFSDADMDFDSVEIISPNRTASTLGIGYGRICRVSNVIVSGFDSSIANGVKINFGEGNSFNGKPLPPLGTSVSTIRNNFVSVENPIRAAQLISGVYHIDFRDSGIDQNSKYLKAYGVVSAGTTDEPTIIPLRIHTNVFAGIINPTIIHGILKLKGIVRHSNTGSFSTQEKHFNFQHKASSVSSVTFPTTPIYTSGLSGQANESLVLTVDTPTQSGVTEVGANGDFWIQINVNLSSGRSSPFYYLNYELELTCV